MKTVFNVSSICIYWGYLGVLISNKEYTLAMVWIGSGFVLSHTVKQDIMEVLA